MVKIKPLQFMLIALFCTFIIIHTIEAQGRLYHLEQEWVEIWINQDGTIDLFYNISITLTQGPDINFIEIGQPKRDFTIGEAIDQYDHLLQASDASSGSDYKVRLNLYSPLRAGQTVWLTLTTNVAHMIYEDAQNPGNVGMRFIPTWWSEARVLDLRILIVLPSGVTSDMVKTLPDRYWNSTGSMEGRLTVYWEESNLSPNEQFPVGLSFPEEYVTNYVKQPSGLMLFLQQYGLPLFGLGLFICLIGAGIYIARKKSYLTPKVGIETLGIRRGLTAVEASYLLELKPPRIVTEILYSLLKKRAVWVESTDPSIKLKVMPQFENGTGTRETPLRYYEIDFLRAIREDGFLDEEKLAKTVMFLRDTVEQKLHGYCRRDTVDYYTSIVAKAWEQVEQAGTPELTSNIYDEQLLWLFLDPENQSRTKKTFSNRSFEPSPLWLWYWYTYHHYHPNPTYEPNIKTPARSGKPPTIPGAEFADNVATAFENTSKNIVENLEKFSNSILPMSAPKASSEPTRRGASCVCACATCACACACVSCACACASGGVG